jgi:rhodanese-related sulfurtransferase
VLSPLAARKAEKLGFTKVKVFHAGLPAWRQAGHETVSNIAGIDQLEKNGLEYILLDLRPAKEVEQGHLPKAVATNEQDLDSLKAQFPKYMSAPIILYNQDGNLEAAKKAYDKITGWGYKQVTVLDGGFSAWQKQNKQIAKGSAETKISYVKKLAPGEFDLDKFKEIIAKGPGNDYYILDVRESSEAEAGSLPNTVNIPLTDLEKRVAELPKDKKIIIHCATGARAEMAYNVLKKADVQGEYVKAKVEVSKDKPNDYKIED